MGVKSTVDLNRKQAEEKYIALRLELSMKDIQKRYKAQAMLMTNSQLEAHLEELNDKANDGEGFKNYNITD